MAQRVHVFLNIIDDVAQEVQSEKSSYDDKKRMLDETIQLTDRVLTRVYNLYRRLIWRNRRDSMVPLIIEVFGEQLEDLSENDFAGFATECRECVQELRFQCDVLKDRATGELVWATASFALAALTIGLFTLVT